jgi:hypothetical protein
MRITQRAIAALVRRVPGVLFTDRGHEQSVPTAETRPPHPALENHHLVAKDH